MEKLFLFCANASRAYFHPDDLFSTYCLHSSAASTEFSPLNLTLLSSSHQPVSQKIHSSAPELFPDRQFSSAAKAQALELDHQPGSLAEALLYLSFCSRSSSSVEWGWEDLKQLFSTRVSIFASQVTSGNVWKHFWLSACKWGRMLFIWWAEAKDAAE